MQLLLQLWFRDKDAIGQWLEEPVARFLRSWDRTPDSQFAEIRSILLKWARARSPDAADYSRFRFRINNASFDLRSCGCRGCSEVERTSRTCIIEKSRERKAGLPLILEGEDSRANRMPQNVRNKWRFLYAIAISKRPTMHPACYYCHYSPVRSRSHFAAAKHSTHTTRSINTRWVSYISSLFNIAIFLSSPFFTFI